MKEGAARSVPADKPLNSRILLSLVWVEAERDMEHSFSGDQAGRSETLRITACGNGTPSGDVRACKARR